MTAPATIPVLSKAIHVIEALARQTPYRSMTQMAKALGIAPATCYRILKTFESADWVRVDPQGRHALSLGLLPLLRPLLDFERLAAVAQPVLADLALAVRLSVKLSVRIGDEAATIARAESPEAMSLSGRVGARFPLGVGSSGAALLSTLDDAAVARVVERSPQHVWRHQAPEDVLARVRQCRAQGFCRDSGSFHPQVHSISSPLRVTHNDMAAAITIMGLPDDFQDDAVARYRKQLLDAARRCERQLQPLLSEHPS